jgi:hypothetical protein
MIEPILVKAEDAAVTTVGCVDLPSPDNTDLSASGVGDPEAGGLCLLTITKVSVSFRVI